MKKEYLELLDEARNLIEMRVRNLVGQKARTKLGKISLTEYDSICDDFYCAPANVTKLFVEDGSVMVEIEDRDGDREVDFFRDLSLADIEQILELL